MKTAPEGAAGCFGRVNPPGPTTMPKSDSKTQNGSDKTAVDFPGRCDRCGRFLGSVKAWNSHDCEPVDERDEFTIGVTAGP